MGSGVDTASGARPDRRPRERRVGSAVTLTDIASHAGVSLATASRVLNGSARTPAESIARRVREAAHELGYVANAQAQALARSATGLVGLVVHDIADPYFSSITRGAQRAAEGQRSQVLLAGAERNERAELKAVAAFAAYRTDAIILAGSRRSQHDVELATELGRYTANGGRVVTLGPSSIPKARHLDIRHRAGAADLVKALVGRGLTEFAILGGPPELNTARQRVEGYRDALDEAGLKPLSVWYGEFNREGGFATAVQCWEQLDEPIGSRVASACSWSTTSWRSAPSRVCAPWVFRCRRTPRSPGSTTFPHCGTSRPRSPPCGFPWRRSARKRSSSPSLPTAEDPVHIDGEAVLRDSAG